MHITRSNARVSMTTEARHTKPHSIGYTLGSFMKPAGVVLTVNDKDPTKRPFVVTLSMSDMEAIAEMYKEYVNAES